MREQEKYKKMMNEIHVSETTLRKVMEMDMSKNNLNKKRMMKKMGTAAAALLLCLVASNGICYAATGHSWVTKAIIYINGEAVEQDVVVEENGDGTMTVTSEIDVPEEGSNSEVASAFVMEDGNMKSVDMSPEEVEEYIESQGLNTINGRVVEKDGKQYFKYHGGETDITEDMADGKASGNVKVFDVEYHYEIAEVDGGYDVSVSTVE